MNAAATHSGPSIHPKIRKIIRQAQIFLTPSATYAAGRAKAARDAAKACDDLLRLCLRAGITSRPDEGFAAEILALRARIVDEAEVIEAFGDEEDEDPTCHVIIKQRTTETPKD
jgi:hypothetical protein